VIQFFMIVLLAYGESRSEGISGMTAVVNVAMNRAEQRKTTVVTEILRRKQFSYFNNNWELVLRDLKNFNLSRDGESLKKAVLVAFKAVRGKLDNNVGEALFYHTTAVKPYWSQDIASTTKIGNHIFY